LSEDKDLAAITETIAGIQRKEAQAKIDRASQKELDRERNRKEFPKTAKIMDLFLASKPRLIYAIEDGKQLGKPDHYSFQQDNPRPKK